MTTSAQVESAVLSFCLCCITSVTLLNEFSTYRVCPGLSVMLFVEYAVHFMNTNIQEKLHGKNLYDLCSAWIAYLLYIHGLGLVYTQVLNVEISQFKV